MSGHRRIRITSSGTYAETLVVEGTPEQLDLLYRICESLRRGTFLQDAAHWTRYSAAVAPSSSDLPLSTTLHIDGPPPLNQGPVTKAREGTGGDSTSVGYHPRPKGAPLRPSDKLIGTPPLKLPLAPRAARIIATPGYDPHPWYVDKYPEHMFGRADCDKGLCQEKDAPYYHWVLWPKEEICDGIIHMRTLTDEERRQDFQAGLPDHNAEIACDKCGRMRRERV